MIEQVDEGVPDDRSSGGTRRPDEPTDDDDVERLQRTLRRITDPEQCRPEVGVDVALTVERAELQRARAALGLLASADRSMESLLRAATSLEVCLEEVLDGLPAAGEHTITVDMADCALMALALLYAAEERCTGPTETDPYRRQGESLRRKVLDDCVGDGDGPPERFVA